MIRERRRAGVENGRRLNRKKKKKQSPSFSFPSFLQAVYRLRFFDGSVAPARVLYYDVSQDFAILKFNR